MKKAIKKLLFIPLVFLLCNSLSAQQGSLSVDTIIGFPDTAYYNDSYSFYVVLRNDDTTSMYSGAVSLACRNDSTQITDTLGTSVQVTIDSGGTDTIGMSGVDFNNTAVFKVGGNVVVIWPVNSNGQITVADTFRTNIVILGYSGISDIELPEGNNNIFPVPANDILFLPQNIAKNSIEHVRIMDILGRQKYFSCKAATSINTSFLEQGVYFIEIKEKNKTPIVLKFMISR
jgi:hypothetical protein